MIYPIPHHAVAAQRVAAWTTAVSSSTKQEYGPKDALFFLFQKKDGDSLELERKKRSSQGLCHFYVQS